MPPPPFFLTQRHEPGKIFCKDWSKQIVTNGCKLKFFFVVFFLYKIMDQRKKFFYRVFCESYYDLQKRNI